MITVIFLIYAARICVYASKCKNYFERNIAIPSFHIVMSGANKGRQVVAPLIYKREAALSL